LLLRVAFEGFTIAGKQKTNCETLQLLGALIEALEEDVVITVEVIGEELVDNVEEDVELVVGEVVVEEDEVCVARYMPTPAAITRTTTIITTVAVEIALRIRLFITGDRTRNYLTISTSREPAK
jgi:hypothetical protein